MTCVEAPACVQLLDDIDRLFPNRRKTIDGICASPEHTQQNPDSDHERGDALDATATRAQGDAIVGRLIEGRDDRILYVIWNGYIWRSYKNHDKHPEPWHAVPYRGDNQHTTHVHISIKHAKRDDTSPWFSREEMQMDAEVQAAFDGLRSTLEVVAETAAETLALVRNMHHRTGLDDQDEGFTNDLSKVVIATRSLAHGVERLADAAVPRSSDDVTVITETPGSDTGGDEA